MSAFALKCRGCIIHSGTTFSIFSLACSLLSIPSAPPTDVQSTTPTNVPEVQPFTEQPTPPSVTSNLPAGFATAKENLLTFYDLHGTQISRVELPQSTFPGRDRTHLAGKMPSSGETVPLLYFSFDNEESLLFRDGTGQIFVIRNGTSFLSLTGVPGEAIVVFSQIDYLDVTLRSKIFIGSIQTLPLAAPIHVVDDPESWAIKPVLVQVENSLPIKVWYTRMAYGIGGDIVFEPRKGLFVLDIATGQVDTILNNDASPWAISLDTNWVAYSTGDWQAGPICIKNLSTGTEPCFPLLPASDSRGAGNAYLSPDAQYVAWMAETPTFKATVRIGQTNGVIVADLPMNTFEVAAGIGLIVRADPVAWLDNQTVIIQVRGQEWSQAALLRSTVISREITYLASGEFVGLLYP